MGEHELETLDDLLTAQVRQRPSQGLIYTRAAGTVTYRDVDGRVNQAANLLIRSGISKGDKVALILPNCPEYLYLWFGAARIGAVHVAINTRLTGEVLRYQIVKSEARLAVVHESFLETYVDAVRNVPDLAHIVMSSAENSGLAAALRQSPSTRPDVDTVLPSDPLVIMFTSGTTGRPKGVINCHNAYARAGRDLCRLMGLGSDDRMYVFMPLFHGNPQMMGVMPILAAGGSIALSPWFSASGFWPEVKELEATVFTHIGSPLPILVKQPPQPDDADNPIRLILGGAPKEVAAEFGKRFGCTVLDGWGMIEAGCNTTITPVDQIVEGTNGVPRECFDVRIFDSDDRELPPGETGEIVVRPKEPYVMFSGYYQDPQRTVEAMGNLWFHTGDLGRIQRDGNLHFLGRAGDSIRRKGENLSPAEIEAVLNSHRSIEEAVVVGVDDDIAGQEILACYIPKDRGLRARDLEAWCQERLPEFMIPRYYRAFFDDFPRTGSHKVQKYKLREVGVHGAWDRTEDD